MGTPEGFVKLKTVKYKRQFHTIYRSINEVQGELKQMLEDEDLEVLQPCERDGSPAPEGVLKAKPIHFFITRKRCHFKLPPNLPFFGGEYEDEEEELDVDDLDDEEEGEDEEGVPTPPPTPVTPAATPVTAPSQQVATPSQPTPIHPHHSPAPPHPTHHPMMPPQPHSPMPPQPVHPQHHPHPSPQHPLLPPPQSPAPVVAPPTTSTTTTTTSTASPHPPPSHAHSPATPTGDKRAPAQNRELLLFVKINNNYYEIRGGLTTKCLGAKKEPEKEDNLIIGRWLWLTCVSNNNKTGVNFTMKCLLVIAGPGDQNIYLTSPQFVTLSTASSRKVTYANQLTMKQDMQNELGEDEEDDEGDEEGEGMQIAYAEGSSQMQMELKGDHPAVATSTTTVSSSDQPSDDMAFTHSGGVGQGVAPPKTPKYALRKGRKVLYKMLGAEGGNSPSQGDTSMGGLTPSSTPLSDRKKGKKVKTFDEWLEELRAFKNVHGHCQPKRKHFGKKENEQKKLAYWVERQRSNWKTGTLSEARKKRLDELGFIWPKKGKKRRSPNDREDDMTLPKPMAKPRVEGEAKKRFEGEKILAEMHRQNVGDVTSSRGDEDRKKMKDEIARVEREKTAFMDQVKKEYEQKTWELLEKWKEEWRTLEQGRRELEEQTKRLQNEQMRTENQKRRAEWGSGVPASALGTPVKKRKLADNGREKEGEDEERGGEDLHEGGETADASHAPSTASTTTSTTSASQPLGLGFTALTILQRLDELLAGQRQILAAVNLHRQPSGN